MIAPLTGAQTLAFVLSVAALIGLGISLHYEGLEGIAGWVSRAPEPRTLDGETVLPERPAIRGTVAPSRAGSRGVRMCFFLAEVFECFGHALEDGYEWRRAMSLPLPPAPPQDLCAAVEGARWSRPASRREGRA